MEAPLLTDNRLPTVRKTLVERISQKPGEIIKQKFGGDKKADDDHSALVLSSAHIKCRSRRSGSH